MGLKVPGRGKSLATSSYVTISSRSNSSFSVRSYIIFLAFDDLAELVPLPGLLPVQMRASGGGGGQLPLDSHAKDEVRTGCGGSGSSIEVAKVPAPHTNAPAPHSPRGLLLRQTVA